MTVRAIYENGVFRPIEQVNLPERAEVEVVLPANGNGDASLDAIYQVMGEQHESGARDVSSRHDEHQP